MRNTLQKWADHATWLPLLGDLRKWRIGRRLKRHLRNWSAVCDAYFAQAAVPELVFHNGLRLSHGAGDSPVLLLLEVFDDEVYRPRDNRPIARVLDLGANIGFFSAWMSTQYPQSSVLAFEPSAATLPTLQANVRQNGLDQITIRTEAVAARTGTAEFMETGSSVIRSLSDVSLPQHQDGRRFTVSTRSLADCIGDAGGDEIDFCKMDVEGAEVDILSAAAPETLRQIQELIIEVHEDRIHGALKTCTQALAHAAFDCEAHWLAPGRLSILRAWRRG